ncbi:MAG: hypothetical protein AAFN38_21810 [Cyanobacteria bacterium J06560_5]
MSSINTIPRGTATQSPVTGSAYLDSPNINPGNRARSNRARTAAQNRARQGKAGNPRLNTRRFSNYQRAKAGQSAPTAPRSSTPAKPTSPIPRGVAAAGPASATGVGAGASIWTATPASVPVATALTVPLALGGGLAVGNKIYEDVLDRPWGPSLGDYLLPRETPERDGPSEPYLAASPEELKFGQMEVEYYFDWFYRFRNPGGSIRERWPPPDDEPNWNGFYPRVFGPIVGPRRRPGTVWYDMIGAGDSKFTSIAAIEQGAVLLEEKLFVRRRDGLPDIPRLEPGDPIPTTPTQPYSPSTPAYEPATIPPTDPLAPANSPPAQPFVPDTTPTPQADERPNPANIPTPTPALIPARAPSPRPSPSPTLTPTGPPAASPPSTRQGSGCGCNGPILSKLERQQESLVGRSQDSTGKILGGAGGASLGAVLAQLLKMQQFAEKAWEATRLQKLINLLTLISVLHNAAMLSRNVGETIGDLTSQMLAVVGINDENGSPLDINELVSGSVESFVQSVVGEEVYNDVSTRWHKASRIVSSAAMIAYTVRNINDTTKDVLEWTAENTGKIGNALKRWGVVGERAYPWMSERVRAQDAYRNKFRRVTEGLEQLEDTASSLSQVTGDVREIQEEFTELGEQRAAFQDLVSQVDPDTIATAAPESTPIATAEAQAKTDNDAPANIELTDASRS